MKALVPVLAALFSQIVIAHPLSPESSCVEPVRPERSDSVRWNAFVAEVDVFRGCIATFVDAQYAASDAHRAAAERAGARWNEFVRNHLNVPEDFPHVPRRDNGSAD